MTVASRGSRWPTTSTLPAGMSAPALRCTVRPAPVAVAGADADVDALAPDVERRRRRPAGRRRPTAGRRRRGGTGPAGIARPARTGRRDRPARSASLRTAPASSSRREQDGRRRGRRQHARRRRGGGPSSQAARAMSSCTQRTRRRSASRATAAGSGSGRSSLGTIDGGRDRPAEGIDIRPGPMRGGSRASTTGSRSTSSSSGTSSARAWATAERASEAPVTVAGAGLGDEQAGERLVAVQADERAAAVAQHGEQLVVGELAERRDGRAGRRRRAATRSAGQRRQSALRRRPTRHAARRRRAGGRGSRRRSSPPGAASTPRAARSAAAMPSTATTSGLRSSASAGVDAGEAQRLAQAVAQRVEPEVLLERRRAGRGTTRRPGRARTRCPSVGGSVVIGRACRRMQRAVGVDGPLDVLRAAEGARRRRRRAGPGGAARRPAGAGRRRRSSATSRTRPRRSSTAVHPSTSPETSWSGPPATAATTRRSRRPVTGSAPNSTPPHGASSIGCTSTAIVGVDEAGVAGPRPRSRATVVDGADEGRLVGDVEDRVEHAGHRRGVAVLAGRRRTHDDRACAAVGDGAARPSTAVSRSSCDQAVVSTTPGRAGSPAARARARLAAFAPTSAGSIAVGSLKTTTEVVVDMVTPSRGAL